MAPTADKFCSGESMNYLLFLIVAVAYNIRKFLKSKDRLIRDLHESNEVRRNAILSHFYWVFVVELFLGTLVAVWLSGEDEALGGIITIIGIFLAVSMLGFFIYQTFLKWVAKQIDPTVNSSFTQYMIKEFRVYFAVAFLPILLYSGMIQAFQDDMGVGFWGLEAIGHILVISVLSIVCTVILMMKLLPNCAVTEPEFLSIINHRLEQANLSYVRVRWIEAEFKNAFVVGINFPFFKNQTMFIGRPLREALGPEEFDAVICHELAHIKQGHMAKRIVSIGWHVLRVSLGSIAVVMSGILGGILVFGTEVGFYLSSIIAPMVMAFIILSFFISYFLFFNAIRAQEFEADAIAVMDFGCRIETLESALQKLQAVDNPYAPKAKKSRLKDIFSTHPTLEQRIEMLHKKVSQGLPFNYYVSPYQKLGTILLSFFKFRYIGTVTALFCIGAFYTVKDFRDFADKRYPLVKASIEELMNNEYLNNHVNDRPLFGHSNLYYVMLRKDRALIDHYLTKGANPEKVLFYLEKFNDHEMFAEYILKLSDQLDDEAYKNVISDFLKQKPSGEILAKVKADSRYQSLGRTEEGERRPASVISTQPDDQ